MRKPLLTAAIGCAAALALLAATTSGASTPAQAEAIKQSKLAFAKFSKAPGPIAIPPIGQPVPTGKSIVAVGVFSTANGNGLKSAAKALGWTLKLVSPQIAPEAFTSAFESALQQKPDGLVVYSPFPLAAFNTQLQRFKQAGIPVVTAGGIGYPIGGSSPVVADTSGANIFGPLGRLYADTVVGLDGGAPKAALVVDPSVPAWKPIIQGFKQRITATGASYSEVPVRLADIGKDMPNQIVSYLQRNPDTQYLMFTIGAMALGVQPALASAGLQGKVKVVVGAADKADVAAVKSGQYAAGVVLETGSASWRVMDAMARALAGANLSCCRHLPSTFLVVTKNNLALAKDIDTFPNQPGAFLKAWGRKK